MKKIIPIISLKIWGKEIWLTSPLKGKPTRYQPIDKNEKWKNSEPVTWGPIIKIIYADEPLSIQVHPDDRLAMELEGQPNGKSESWYIMKCDENSRIVLGLNNYYFQTIAQSLEENSIERHLNIVKPRINQFFDIPAGLVHGLGTPNHSKIVVLEVQQPSDTTYRFWDYNRLDKKGNLRELHKEKALKSIKELDYKPKLVWFNSDEQYITEHYKITVIRNNKSAWTKGFAVVKSIMFYQAVELTKDEEFPSHTKFFVEENTN